MATGKISRLPREIREQLNRRPDDDEPGKRPVAWPRAEGGGSGGKEAELEPIKVDQGEIFKNEEVRTRFVDCSPSPQSSPPGRGDDLARVWIQESITTSATMGMQTGENLAKLKLIKANQG